MWTHFLQCFLLQYFHLQGRFSFEMLSTLKNSMIVRMGNNAHFLTNLCRQHCLPTKATCRRSYLVITNITVQLLLNGRFLSLVKSGWLCNLSHLSCCLMQKHRQVLHSYSLQNSFRLFQVEKMFLLTPEMLVDLFQLQVSLENLRPIL